LEIISPDNPFSNQAVIEIGAFEQSPGDTAKNASDNIPDNQYELSDDQIKN
jgi:hypothetical protein